MDRDKVKESNHAPWFNSMPKIRQTREGNCTGKNASNLILSSCSYLIWSDG
jgi:hypothetical protein